MRTHLNTHHIYKLIMIVVVLFCVTNLNAGTIFVDDDGASIYFCICPIVNTVVKVKP